MTDHTGWDDDGDAEMDRRLRDGGAALRESFASSTEDDASATGAVVSHLHSARTTRRRSWLAPVAAAAVGALAASAITFGIANNRGVERAAGPDVSAGMEAFLDELPDSPIDPHDVRFVSSVSSFDTCDALLDRLRRVGAEHVGSRGFGEWYSNPLVFGADDGFQVQSKSASEGAPESMRLPGPSGETIGTNVQVAGVDETDTVKAVGTLVYTVRGDRLRIADTASSSVLSVTDLDVGDQERRSASSSELLVSKNIVVVFGSEFVESEPVAGDPSASTSSTSYITITQLDVTDPAAPKVSSRSRVEGRLVAARLVGDQVRMVTGSSMSDIGFVTPTSPASVRVALESNRRVLAASSVGDWIPEYDAGAGTDSTPIAGCDDVYLPDTFAGVSMTTMTNFTADGTFTPQATSIVAPSDVVYATADTVAVASTIWVDPSERDDNFDDWSSAVHRFDLSTETPAYVASGEVAGSIGGQFNFGQVGDALAVIAAEGTPWSSDANEVTLTTFGVEGTKLVPVGTLPDLGGAVGGVSAVRFTGSRVFVSSPFGNELAVVDLSNPATPRQTATIGLGGNSTYLHPVSDVAVIALGSRGFEIGSGTQRRSASASHADLVDTTDPAAPTVQGTWDQEYSSTQAANDHHAFLYWSSAKLMGFPLQPTTPDAIGFALPPNATFVSTEPGLAARAAVTPERVNVEPPCPTLDPADFRAQLGDQYRDVTVLKCGTPRVPDFPGRSCSNAYGETTELDGVFFCSRMPWADVVRTLVVNGTPWIYTSESLQSLDPDTFASTGVIPIG